MPEEVLPIVVIAILSFTGLSIFIIHSVLSYLRDKAGLKAESKEQSSLTTSELESMLRRVVEEVTSPMADRIAALEDQFSATPKVAQLTEAQKRLRDAFDEAVDDEGPRDLAAISAKRLCHYRQMRPLKWYWQYRQVLH